MRDMMQKGEILLPLFFAIVAITNARPQQNFEDVFDKKSETMLRNYARDTGMLPAETTYERQSKISNIDDLTRMHHMMFNNKAKKLYDQMDRKASIKSPVHIRTQWEGSKDLETNDPSQTAVRNTINVNTYHSKKANLNLIMDSKFVQKGDKMEPVDPSFGLNFQIKY